MNKKRPINLDLLTIRTTPMMIGSILHRISGVVLFILLPVMIYLLNKSLSSLDTFVELQGLMLTIKYKFIVWVFSTAYIYHLLAGIRHMVMDLGYGEHLDTSRNSATGVIILAVIMAIFLGIWIC